MHINDFPRPNSTLTRHQGGLILTIIYYYFACQTSASIDPRTGVQTQEVESAWRNLKLPEKQRKSYEERICNLFRWADVATIWRWDNQRDKMRSYMANLRLQIPTDTPVFGTSGYIKNNPALRYLSAGIICSKRWTFSPRTRLEKYYTKKLRGKDNILRQIHKNIFAPIAGYLISFIIL